MNSKPLPDELNRVMLKIRQQHHWNEPASSCVTLEKIVETLASERDEWKAKAKELERQLHESKSENNELRLSLEKESDALANCTAECHKEIASIVEKKNEEMKEVLECLVIYKNQLMSILNLANESYEFMATAEEVQADTARRRDLFSHAQALEPRQKNEELQDDEWRQDLDVKKSVSAAGTGLANLLSFHTQKIMGGSRRKL